jgi:hypothetical protein
MCLDLSSDHGVCLIYGLFDIYHIDLMGGGGVGSHRVKVVLSTYGYITGDAPHYLVGGLAGGLFTHWQSFIRM